MLRLPQTLYGRMTLGVGLITGIMLAAEAWMLNWQVHSSIQELHGLRLEASSAPIIERLMRQGVAGVNAPLPRPYAERFDPLTGSQHFVVLSPDGKVLAASDALAQDGPRPGIPRLDLLRQSRTTFRSSGQDHRLWGLSRWVETPDGPVVLQVAQDMRSLFVMLDDVPAATLGPVLLAFAAGAALLILLFASLTRLMLGPLRRAAAEAAGITPGSGQRLNETGVPAEARPLIQAVNGALDRLEAALRQQRNFSQDLAHELRTPLAIMMGEIDVIEDTETAARLRRDIASLARLVDELLGAAEAISTEPKPGAVVDLVPLCHGVAQALAPLAHRAGCRLDVSAEAPSVLANGEAEALGRAVRNLVENAICHAPPDSTVEIRVSPPASLAVADRGPGVPPALRDRIFQRFWQADRARQNGKGTGLGLAIVAGIVAAHGGSVAVEDHEGGGAIFSIRLRPADISAAMPRPALEGAH
jgi:two-component system, OmpR family, sensor histidine kinase TctE